MKIVINADYGGFGLSEEAIRRYATKAGLKLIESGPDKYGFTHFYRNELGEDNYFIDRDIPRNDESLVAVVEEMGEESWGRYSELKVVEIPNDVNWYIEEYDGLEWIAERHRTWA